MLNDWGETRTRPVKSLKVKMGDVIFIEWNDPSNLLTTDNHIWLELRLNGALIHAVRS